jgi:hypothetical protein
MHKNILKIQLSGKKHSTKEEYKDLLQRNEGHKRKTHKNNIYISERLEDFSPKIRSLT